MVTIVDEGMIVWRVITGIHRSSKLKIQGDKSFAIKLFMEVRFAIQYFIVVVVRRPREAKITNWEVS